MVTTEGSSHSADLLALSKRQGVLKGHIDALNRLVTDTSESEISKIAELNTMERELVEIACRRHELMEAPRAEHSMAMVIRTVTSLMIANGAALGILGAGLFESNEPRYVLKTLQGPGWMFFLGLFLAGIIPPAMYISGRRKATAEEVKGWRRFIVVAMLASAFCLFGGLWRIYAGADTYVRCVSGEGVPGICEAKPPQAAQPSG